MSEERIKLIDASAVAEMLSISRSTLYRMCNLDEPSTTLGFNSSKLKKPPVENTTIKRLKGLQSNSYMSELQNLIDNRNEDRSYASFPRPYLISRTHKWNYYEVWEWLKNQQV